jgi:hypothetical protein
MCRRSGKKPAAFINAQGKRCSRTQSPRERIADVCLAQRAALRLHSDREKPPFLNLTRINH